MPRICFSPSRRSGFSSPFRKKGGFLSFFDFSFTYLIRLLAILTGREITLGGRRHAASRRRRCITAQWSRPRWLHLRLRLLRTLGGGGLSRALFVFYQGS